MSSWTHQGGQTKMKVSLLMSPSCITSHCIQSLCQGHPRASDSQLDNVWTTGWPRRPSPGTVAPCWEWGPSREAKGQHPWAREADTIFSENTNSISRAYDRQFPTLSADCSEWHFVPSHDWWWRRGHCLETWVWFGIFQLTCFVALDRSCHTPSLSIWWQTWELFLVTDMTSLSCRFNCSPNCSSECC